MGHSFGYRILSGAVAAMSAVVGAALFAAFVSNTLLPHGMQIDLGMVSTNYWGYYMTGFAGALLLTWAGFLLVAVRRPLAARGIGTATAFGLVANALFRSIAWFSGEYAEAGNVLRAEAAVMLLLALGFLWLRPPQAAGAGRE